jgi:5-formyltetrahydrofolate cyclo-ligase
LEYDMVLHATGRSSPTGADTSASCVWMVGVQSGDTPPDKAARRTSAIRGRRELDPDTRSAGRRANARRLRELLTGPSVVAAFLPLPSEPLDPGLLDDLIADGHRVLVPVTSADAALDWVEYPCATRPGAFGIATPVGPLLGADALARADVVLVPAFAVDRQGHRLGRGGGHYDRSLPYASARTRRIAVLFDGELTDTLPADPHDQPVDAVLQPTAGLTELRRARLQ